MAEEKIQEGPPPQGLSASTASHIIASGKLVGTCAAGESLRGAAVFILTRIMFWKILRKNLP